MHKKIDYSRSWQFPIKKMDNEKYITKRISKYELNEQKREVLTNILKFLYFKNYKHTIYRHTIRKYKEYLTEVEAKTAYWLQIRCSGSERKNYGINSVLAVKRDKYSCRICGEKDIRCLEIDHIPEKFDNDGKKTRGGFAVKEFQCLCANHHRIKTRNYSKSKIPN